MAYLNQSSPRKIVPLAGGSSDLQRTKSEQPAAPPTRRAYFCGVVVENDLEGHGLARDVQQLLYSLGEIVSRSGDKTGMERSTSAPNVANPINLADVSNGRERALTTTSAYNDVLNELVVTERSYVAKLRILKVSYADPLRKFARRAEEALLPAYEAKTLFGNIDTILPANEAFLADLEEMMSGSGNVGGVGDVALKHIRDLRAFDCYKQYYSKREEAQGIFEREAMKKANTGFNEYIERTKYSTESKNRVGLRELLMEPIQRIPRYTLMFRIMIKHMSPTDPQRAKLIEADEAASKIALAETDEPTKRATVMHCLERSIEGFPPNLFSNGRTFIDCIDVEDAPAVELLGPGYVANSSGDRTAAGPLHCTLFLFDDRLLIVKRPNGASTGRSLSGLDEMDRAMRTGSLPTGIRKGSMSCKGVVDVTDLVATDVGGADFHVYLEEPLHDQSSDRWANRPFRSYAVAHPPAPPNYDPVRTRNDKRRFLENLWNAQALYRSKDGRSLARVSEEREMSGKSMVRTWFNIYQRTDWLKETKKNKIVLHIDPMGSADPLPFGLNGPPYVIVRVQPMAGDLCRYTVTSNDPTDEPEEDIVHTAAVPARIVQTIHQFGLFKFRTGRNSLPSTPTASVRSRTSMFGLDAISRNLFNASTSIRNGDVFGIGSISSGRSRVKSSTISRSSTVTTGTADSSKFSQRSGSTAGTSFSSLGLDDEEPKRGSSMLATPVPRKLVKRGRSPGVTSGAESGSEADIERKGSGSISRGSQRRRKSGRRDGGLDDDEPITNGANDLGGAIVMDESEWDLSMRLELARKNSQSQEAGKPKTTINLAGLQRQGIIDEDTIMEVSLSAALSTQAQQGSANISEYGGASDNSPPQASLWSHPESITPTPSFADNKPPSLYSTNADRRPMGPRSPARSPPHTLPTTPSRPPTPSHISANHTGSSWRPPSRPTTPTSRGQTISLNHALPPVPPLPMSRVGSNPTIDELERAVSPVAARRMVFESAIPKPVSRVAPPALPLVRTASGGASTSSRTSVPSPVEPLLIRKKSIRGSSPPSRKSIASSLEKNPATRRLSTQKRNDRQAVAAEVVNSLQDVDELTPQERREEERLSKPIDSANPMVVLAQMTRSDADSCCRAVKRIKLEVHSMKASTGSTASTRDPVSRIRAPNGSIPRSPQSRHISNKAVEARMEEMRQMIQSRQGRPAPAVQDTAGPSTSLQDVEGPAQKVETLVDEAEHYLDRISDAQTRIESEAARIVAEAQQKTKEASRIANEVGRAKRQCDLVKKLLADATAENEIMYEAFNEELDGMFNDANLPETDAWEAMTSDLRRTKEARNKLATENTSLRRKLEEVELQNKEWETLLRSHGLIS